jgi:ketosteroid isomerase-like protein
MYTLLIVFLVILFISNFTIEAIDQSIDSNGNTETITKSYYVDLLKRFNEAFNSHDSDALISMMTEDCVFSTSMGLIGQPSGTQVVGLSNVKAAFDTTFANFPDARWIPRDKDFVATDDNNIWFGLSPWTFQGTRKSDGAKFDTNGVDVFTMKEGKIYLKDAFRKDVPPLLQ